VSLRRGHSFFEDAKSPAFLDAVSSRLQCAHGDRSPTDPAFDAQSSNEDFVVAIPAGIIAKRNFQGVRQRSGMIKVGSFLPEFDWDCCLLVLSI
jgi:hypothetical protein